jgi:hypothetical protein
VLPEREPLAALGTDQDDHRIVHGSIRNLYSTRWHSGPCLGGMRYNVIARQDPRLHPLIVPLTDYVANHGSDPCVRNLLPSPVERYRRNTQANNAREAYFLVLSCI